MPVDFAFMIQCSILSVMFHHLYRYIASMGAFLLADGTKGKRMALPNAEIMIHQPSAEQKDRQRRSRS